MKIIASKELISKLAPYATLEHRLLRRQGLEDEFLLALRQHPRADWFPYALGRTLDRNVWEAMQEHELPEKYGPQLMRKVKAFLLAQGVRRVRTQVSFKDEPTFREDRKYAIKEVFRKVHLRLPELRHDGEGGFRPAAQDLLKASSAGSYIDARARIGAAYEAIAYQAFLGKKGCAVRMYDMLIEFNNAVGVEMDSYSLRQAGRSTRQMREHCIETAEKWVSDLAKRSGREINLIAQASVDYCIGVFAPKKKPPLSKRKPRKKELKKSETAAKSRKITIGEDAFDVKKIAEMLVAWQFLARVNKGNALLPDLSIVPRITVTCFDSEQRIMLLKSLQEEIKPQRGGPSQKDIDGVKALLIELG